jgi:D-alanyl-D-alanine carboxypeptidase (penicillin-binding protein 5/6)
MHLKLGEKISAHDMLCAILMRSANDGCVAAAEHIAGSEAAFVAMMNTRARQLGALHTHFMNPHGLHAPLHYTTARDLVLIARAAMCEPRFRDVVRTQHCRIARSVDHDDVTLRNHSHFLGHFPGADGIKTGWTVPAGHCYVGSATQNNWRLISVVLKSPDYVEETSALMKYGFANFEAHSIARAGETAGLCQVKAGVRATVLCAVQNAVQYVTRKGDLTQAERRVQLTTATAPVPVGAPVGVLQAYVGGRLAASSPVVTMEAVAALPIQMQIGKTGPWKGVLSTILATSLVSLLYGTRYRSRFAALAKSARRRRRRLTQSLRDDDLGR